LEKWVKSLPKSKVAKWEMFDEGVWTGTESDRPVRERLIQEALDGKWTKIVVLTADRWSRNWHDAGSTLLRLEPAGVALYDKGNDLESSLPKAERPRDALMLALFFGLATEFVGTSKVKTFEGVLAAAKKGRIGGSWPSMHYPWHLMRDWSVAGLGGKKMGTLLAMALDEPKRKDPGTMRIQRDRILERIERGVFDNWLEVIEALNRVEAGWSRQRGGEKQYMDFRNQFKGYVIYAGLPEPKTGIVFPEVTENMVLEAAQFEQPQWTF
jgi:DNA invertase Pin-like site-specific DNA recombinase